MSASPTASRRTGAWTERRLERRLFILSALTIGTGFLSVMLVKLSNAPVLDVRYLVPFLAYVLALCVIHLLLVAMRFRGDQVIPAAALFLSGVGILAQFRMGTYDVTRPLAWSQVALPLGLGAMLACALLLRGRRHRLLARLSLPAVLGAIGLLVFILAAGRRFRGMMFLPGNINPSELAKVLLVIFLADFMCLHGKDLEQSEADMPIPPLRTLLPLAVFWAVPMALLLLQRDLGMVVQLNVVLIALLFVATGRWLYVLAASGLVFGAGALICRLGLHGSQRILTWLDPFRDATGEGWQVLQSLAALYSGGLFGTGWGTGSPSSVPIASSDFIYAAIGEEIGYAGCGLILLVFLVLFHRGFSIARRLKGPFSRLLTAGLISSLAVQTLLNVAGVTKALPLTGITLPFISHGGSSLFTSFVMIGIVLAASEEEPAGLSAPEPRAGKRRATARPPRRRA